MLKDQKKKKIQAVETKQPLDTDSYMAAILE